MFHAPWKSESTLRRNRITRAGHNEMAPVAGTVHTEGSAGVTTNENAEENIGESRATTCCPRRLTSCKVDDGAHFGLKKKVSLNNRWEK